MPLVAHTRSSRLPVDQAAYDCVTILLMRNGSAIFKSDKGQQPISVGDALLISSSALTAHAPEGEATATTLLIDTELSDRASVLAVPRFDPKRDAAGDLAAKLYPAQVLRIDEREIERLWPILDEPVALTETSQGAAGYFCAHAHLVAALEAVTPASATSCQALKTFPSAQSCLMGKVADTLTV